MAAAASSTDKPAYRRTLTDRKSTRLNSSHLGISYAVFCLKKKKDHNRAVRRGGAHPPRGGRVEPSSGGEGSKSRRRVTMSTGITTHGDRPRRGEHARMTTG